ncbi:hypothetical protein CP8484711_2156, partial [Chlamydia psittaci 84-8471/1]
MCLRS